VLFQFAGVGIEDHSVVSTGSTMMIKYLNDASFHLLVIYNFLFKSICTNLFY